MFIASDANAAGLTEIAWRAGRKPARGGVKNLICIAESLDALASELPAVADRITVILPWGSLLRAVATPELFSLEHIAHLCLPQAEVEIVLSYDQQRDAPQGVLLSAGEFGEEHIAALRHVYQQAGLEFVRAAQFSQQELAGYQTTWAGRLAFGRPRKIWHLRARFAGP